MGNTSAGIYNGDDDVAAFGTKGGCEGDVSGFGEFDGVEENAGDELCKVTFVDKEGFRYGRINGPFDRLG